MINDSPNVYAMLIALIQMLGTSFAVYLAYRKMRSGQDPKLENIEQKVINTEVLVNGDRAAKEARIRAQEVYIQALEGRLRDHGVKPDA